MTAIFNRRHETMPHDELEQFQLERLQALLARLRRNVPRYSQHSSELRANSLVTWRSFSDPKGRIAKQYQVVRKPWVFVLDQKRVIQSIGGPGAFVDLTVEALLMPPKVRAK